MPSLRMPWPFASRSLANPEPWLVKVLGGGARSASGRQVSAETALRSTTVYSCVTIIASSIAMMGLPVLKATAGAGKTRATDHALYPVLNYKANAEQSAYEWREMMTGHVLLRGNAYSEIMFDGGGQVRGLWPLPATTTHPKRMPDGSLRYYIDGINKWLPAERVLHVRTMSSDGLMGISPITMAREAIGLSLATEEYGARFFSNDARPGGYLQMPGKLSKEGGDRLVESFESAHSGLSNAHRMALLEEGVTFQAVGIAPEDAQFLQTREYQVAEIARIFHMPLHMLDMREQTKSNAEQQGMDFVTYTLGSWISRWEGAIARALLTAAEVQAGYAVEFDPRKLLRGDSATRSTVNAAMRGQGVINADEWRADEGMNPIPDGSGKLYLIPLNMAVNGPDGPKPIAGPTPPPPPGEPSTPASPVPEPKRSEARAMSGAGKRSATLRRALRNSSRPVLRDAMQRIAKRERADVMRQAEKMIGKRDDAQFGTWLNSFITDHKDFIRTAAAPALTAYAESVNAVASDEIGGDGTMTPAVRSFVNDYVDVFVARQAGDTLGSIRRALASAGPDPAAQVSALSALLDSRVATTADSTADYEAVRAGDAVARATYVDGGVTSLVWQTSGEPCPYCEALDGEVVGIEKNFVTAGDDFQPDGADSALNPSTDIGHAPLHRGCDCTISAG